MRRLPWVGVLALSACAFGLLAPSAVEAAEPASITLEQAVDSALRNHPRLKILATEQEAAKGRVLQASLRPNPELAAEVANLSGDLPLSRRSETTLGVSQLLELGGKRPKRTRRAEAEARLLAYDHDSLRLDVVADVHRAYVELLGAQRRLSLKREALDLSSRLAETIGEKVKAGAVSPIEETRARVALAVAKTEVERELRTVEEARIALGAAVGDPGPSFPGASGALREDLYVPDWDKVLERIPRNPDLARWEAERTERRAALEAERSLAVPDVTVGGAYRRIEEDRVNTFVLTASVPLVLFNKNQGAIRAAAAGVAKVEEERRTAELGVRSGLAKGYASLQASVQEVRILQEEALSGAQQAYDAVLEGYRLGKFRYLDVLDAGNALVQAKIQHLEALVALNLARVEVERLVGEPVLPPEEPVRN